MKLIICYLILMVGGKVPQITLNPSGGLLGEAIILLFVLSIIESFLKGGNE